MNASEPEATLLTFPPMIDSEVGRFALTHYGINYREVPHIVGVSSILALLRTGSIAIPLFQGGGLKRAGGRAIIDTFEAKCAADKKLVPQDGMLALQVEADWNRYNGILAAATAVYCYHILLPHRDIMIEPLTRGAPEWETRSMRNHYAAYAVLLKAFLGLSDTAAWDGLEQIRILFEETDRRLADGRNYLVGDRLTLADIALATAAFPVVLPPESQSPIPEWRDMPSELQTLITEMQATRTGQFVLEIYRRHRNGA